MNVSLISGHNKNWYAGASTVFLHLDQELCLYGIQTNLYHLENYRQSRLPGFVQKYSTAISMSRKLLPKVISSDVVEVAGNYGWFLFDRIKRTRGNTRPLLVARLHGLEFKDEQARISEEIARSTKLSWQYRALSRHWLNWQEFETIRLADLVICHTSREVDAIVTAKLKSEHQVIYMPLGVDEDFLTQEPTIGDGQKLLWWGSWIERKGVSSLPRAFELARKTDPELTLTIGGTGKDPNEVLRFFSDGDRSSVTVLPFVTHQEHINLLKSHDIFLFPSLSEGFGLALVEAMASGVPSVTTFTGIAHDFLEHGVNCLLVPMNGPTAFARAILKLSGDVDLRKKIASGGLATASTLTWQHTAQATITAYDQHIALLKTRRK